MLGRELSSLKEKGYGWARMAVLGQVDPTLLPPDSRLSVPVCPRSPLGELHRSEERSITPFSKFRKTGS